VLARVDRALERLHVDIREIKGRTDGGEIAEGS